MADAYASPEKDGYLLVTIQYGDPASPSFQRYTDWPQDQQGHTSVPSMEVDIPENTLTFEENELEVKLPPDSFLADASAGLRFSPMYIQVEEVTRGIFAGDAGGQQVLFKGRVKRIIKNFEKDPDIVAIYAKPRKAEMRTRLGISVTHQCGDNLFGPHCQLVRAVFARTGQILNINGKVVTIDAVNSPAVVAPTSPGGNVDRYWERGYLEFEGRRINVYKWELTDPTRFVLREVPQASWANAGPTSITFVPGCHKNIAIDDLGVKSGDCIDVYDNEINFFGVGFAIPPYQPNFENPEQC